MGDRGRSDRRQQPIRGGGAEADAGRDQGQLAAGRRAGGVIVAGERRGPAQHFAGLVGPAEHEQGLGGGRSGIIVARLGDGGIGQDGLGQSSRFVVPAGQQRQACRVDAGIGFLALVEDRAIGPIGRVERRRAPVAVRHCQSAILEQPRAGRALVRVLGTVEAVLLEERHGALGVAHAGERQHMLVADVARFVATVDRRDGGVVRGDIVAARHRRFGGLRRGGHAGQLVRGSAPPMIIGTLTLVSMPGGGNFVADAARRI
jgi:hypothetical protein